MKGFLIKISILFLALLTLFSSLYVTIDRHHCCGTIVDISIFGKADVCKMNMVSCKIENTSTSKILGSCCHNTYSYKYVEDLKKSDLKNIDFQQFNFTPSFYLTTASNLFIEPEISNNYFNLYKPPIITRDILILVQSFLI